MWPFSPKPKELSALPGISDASHHWGIAKAEYGGSPLLIRFNKSAEEWVGNAGLPIKLGFAIPLNLPNENGLPDPDENQQLNDVEDVILREVEAGTMVELISSVGTVVTEMGISGNEARIATADLAEGMYFYRIVNNQTVNASGRIIVQH